MDLGRSFETLGIALGLGLLVGMQRERVNAPLAGVRTFALITLLGAIAGLLSATLGPWIVVAGFAGVTLTVVIGNVVALKGTRLDPGITTEIAILLMYALGVYLVFGHRAVAVVVAAGVTVLLHAKPSMHRVVERLGENDMRAIIQFVLISLVILPVLPDRAYGPFQVLNPREIWWMVVLVVGISLAGYVVLKLFGERTGIVLGGLIGGMVSSTATTVSQSRRSSAARGQQVAATLVILLATTMVYVRVLVEIGIVSPRSFVSLAPPVAVMFAVSLMLSAAYAWRHRRLESDTAPQENPTEFKSALVFGALYAVVLLAVAAAKSRFGDQGFLIAAGLSGLTDMDAITLSASRLADRGTVETTLAWQAIVLASISNLVFKNGVVAALGGAELARRVAMPFGIQAAVGVALLLLWPRG